MKNKSFWVEYKYLLQKKKNMFKDKNSHKESDFETAFVNHMINENGFIERTNSNYDKTACLDEELVKQFIVSTQKETLKNLEDMNFCNNVLDYIVNELDRHITSFGILDILVSGFDIYGKHIKFCNFKSNGYKNDSLLLNYEKNIFSIMRQAVNTDLSRPDILLFLNGIPFSTIELKSSFNWQYIEDAKLQYMDRDFKRVKLFQNERCIFHVAMDDTQVEITTQLRKKDTKFIPFNEFEDTECEGNKAYYDFKRLNNPNNDSKTWYITDYLYRDYLTKDSILDLIRNFIFVKKDYSSRVSQQIFPKKHQIDTVREIRNEVFRSKSIGRNFLIQHSPGSGKTFTIVWLAHMLSLIHNPDTKKKEYDFVLILSDRKVVDKQNSNDFDSFAVSQNYKWLYKVVHTTTELTQAIKNNTPIIISTIQKFWYVEAEWINNSGKKFAIIIDEAHSWQNGEMSGNLNKLMLRNSDENTGSQSLITAIENEMLSRKAKLPNASFFAFTATPKASTLEVFWEKTPSGAFVPFSLYSMNQSIKEGCILNALNYYRKFDTYFNVKATGKEQDEYEKDYVKNIIAKITANSPDVMKEKAKIIVDDYLWLNGSISKRWLIKWRGKAMVVMSSRAKVIEQVEHIRNYLESIGRSDLKVLWAFSGKETYNGKEYDEATVNNRDGNIVVDIQDEFNKKDYAFLVVADKFQTGFNQPLLVALYIDKILNGIECVQTISRLNRIFEGKTAVYILDFQNSYEDIEEAFKPYQSVTILSKGIETNDIYKLKKAVYKPMLFTEELVKEACEYHRDNKDKWTKQCHKIMQPVVAQFFNMDDKAQKTYITNVRKFIKAFSFIQKVMVQDDVSLYLLMYFLKDIFIPSLKLTINSDKREYWDLYRELEEILVIVDFSIKNTFTSEQKPLIASPFINPDSVDRKIDKNNVKEEKTAMATLEELIEEINNQYGWVLWNEETWIIFDSCKSLLSDNTFIRKYSKANKYNGEEMLEKEIKKKLDNTIKHASGAKKFLEKNNIYEDLAIGIRKVFKMQLG